jgi:hypothetical protein
MSTSIYPVLPPRPLIFVDAPPILVRRDETPAPAGPARRTKIWDFNTNLHCSIIGTCLSTGDVRQILKKLGVASPDSSDHELHGAAVGIAGHHDKAAKLLNKALDERHRLAINQFAKAHSEDEVHAAWRDAVRRGDIPGAYWAALTHPNTTQTIIREAFREVHMLSHLVGAANRADIRRLHQLEADNAELQARLDRQQLAVREVVVSRDATIRDLQQALTKRIVTEPCVGDDDSAVLRQLVADLERRLTHETRRGVVLGERLIETRADLAAERSARSNAERDRRALQEELDHIDASVMAQCNQVTPAVEQPQLSGVTLLYVGGRPHQVAHLRAAAEHSGLRFMHHDGGIEHHLNLLAGLTSQADLLVFPVDCNCISHHAALTAKQLCRQTSKRFIPLRSASATSLLAALRRPEVAALAVQPVA